MESSSDGRMFDPGISFSSMKQPPLIKQLKGILSEYPDGGQILKELIQNAEDAEATEVSILYDGRCINDQYSGSTQTYNKFFKGPALCVFNDAIFTDEDWDGIRMIYSSVKEEDPLKVGRFGLGFKSVFHITDYPCVISGNKLLMIDPQQPTDRVNAMVNLSRVGALETSGLTSEAFWAAFDGIFGMSRESIKDGHFQGTIFWFPLRQKASELSETLYNESKVFDLFEGFNSEQSCILLFLKTLERITVCTRENQTKILELIKVEIKDDTGTVRQSRRNFKKKIQAIVKECNGKDIKNEMHISISTTTRGKRQRYDWMVVNCFIGKSATADFKKLIQDGSLHYSPYVSVAAPLHGSKDVFEGHVFCFLPLPREGSRLTGLPVHVNGFFALSQNRHHLKWVTDEQKGRKIDDNAILWNKYLIAEAIPKAYEMLIRALIARSVSCGNTPEMVAPVYSCLPISSNMHNTWLVLEIELYARLSTSPLLFNKHKKKWVSLLESCFATFSNMPHDMMHVQNAVKMCLHEIGKHYVDIPPELFLTFKRHYTHIQDLTPQLLTDYLLQNPAYRNMSHACKLDILTYILSDKVYEKLNGVELLPLHSGQWTSFNTIGQAVFFCSENEMEILHGQEQRLVLSVSSLGKPLANHFRKLCTSGLSQVREMTTSALIDLLDYTIKCHLGTSGVLRLTRSTNLSIQWLQQVWRFISTNGNISSFTQLQIIPVLKSGTWINPKIIDLVRMSDLLLVKSKRGDCFPDEVCRCFQIMGVTVLEELPEWIPENLISPYCFWPSSKSAIALLSRISSTVYVAHTITAFNQQCSWNDKVAMRKLLERSQFEMTNEARCLIRELQIFRAINYTNEDGYDASVSQVPCFISGSECLPETVQLPFTCLRVRSSSLEVFLTQLGARKVSVDEIVSQTLKCFASGRIQKNDEKRIFVEYFISSFHLFKNKETIVHYARNLPFLRTGPSSREYKAVDLFDPSNELICNLLLGESLTPELNTWNSEEHILVLRYLGLKEIKDIDSLVACQVAKTLDKLSRKRKHDDTLKLKAAAFMQLLHCKPSLLGDSCINEVRLADCIKSLSCIPVQNKVPSYYPKCLNWYSHKQLLCKPSEAKDVSLCILIGATMPTVACKSKHMIDMFRWNDPPALLYVFEQLKMIRNCNSKHNRSEIMPVIKAVYEHLGKREDEVLHQKSELSSEQVIWTGEEFVSADKVITYKKKDNLDLRPHYFCLPEEYSHIRNLFINLGCPRQQDIRILQKALYDISVLHDTLQSGQMVRRDRRIVCDILEKIAKQVLEGFFSNEDLDILIMVQDSDPNKLRVRPVAECTYDDDPVCFYEDDDNICLVHEMIPFEIAETLGVKSISNKAALDAEELGVEEWGQNEHLTTRLHALLRDGYTDGLSVPKELIQNADDAGASTVKFLYDERQNLQMRERVLSKGMKAFQGPALWVFNDAKFSDEDLRNITKLNAATKQRDVKKIGKFGLGFCSVYNLTDMPSFVTGSSVVFFDPHEKNLGSVLRSKGTGLKYRLPNKNLVSRHIDQFKLYEDVFGCNITSDSFSEYNGTLFRLPLRTEHQAKESKIYPVSYTHEEMIQLLRLFIKAAGNMLIFSQNIKSIEIHHLRENSRLASDAELLFKVHKVTQRWENHIFRPVTESVLSRMPDCLMRNRSLLEIHKTIISQIIKTSCKNLVQFLDDVAETSETVWLISWAKGNSRSLTMSKSMEWEGAVPLSAIAVPCTSLLNWTPTVLRDVGPGFYRDGHFFCFLPLPLCTELQMHINGCFAVTSNRRQLVSVTEDDKGNRRNAWNSTLLQDASVVSFVHLLETLAEQSMNIDRSYKYYDLWPACSSKDVLPFKNAFYTHIIGTEAKVFHGSHSWVTFQEVVFLNPQILQRTYGDLAFEVMLHFKPRGGKIFIEMPAYILENILQNNKDELDRIHSAVISEKQFFLIFLGNIQDKFWADRMNDRNSLIAAAINLSEKDIRNTLKAMNCIPTEPLQNLKNPKELIHPNSKVSYLFDTEDERFPIHTKEFRSSAFLEKLVELGMNDKILPTYLFIDRCASVSKIAETCCSCARKRCVTVIEYTCNDGVLAQLESEVGTLSIITNLCMFPVLVKPKTWKFPWFAEAKESSLLSFIQSRHCRSHTAMGEVLLLGQSKNLFRGDLCDYIGSIRCLIDERVFHSVKTRQDSVRRLFQILGVKDFYGIPMQILVDQICLLSREYLDKSVQFEELRKLHNKIFDVFENIMKLRTNSQNSLGCLNPLRDIPVVLIGKDLVRTEEVAFYVKEEYKPLLCRLPENDGLRWKTIYKYLGVKEYFDIQYILRLMASLKENWQSDEKSVEHMTALLINLKNTMEKTNTQYEAIQEFHDLIFAPDTYCRLWPTYELATENLDFSSNVAIKTLHKDIPPSVGEALGVKSKELKCFEHISVGVSFGQRENLLTRIKGLLKAYPCDASIMRELLQNADDAGATEIHFVKDYRKHVSDRLFSKTCEPLQGPSLCVYNNSYFTREDLEGIHNLGQGSKSDDPNKTGQYGVGFNAVYHLTDTPAFVSKGPVESDSFLLILDPLCEHVPRATVSEPGQLCKLTDVQNNFPDHLLGFSQDKLITGKCGTIFRFPLRSKRSEIGRQTIDPKHMDCILDTFKDEMYEAVIFLKNIKLVKVSNISTGDLKEEFSVSAQLSDADSKKRKQFNDTIIAITNKNKDKKEDNLDTAPREVFYPLTVIDSNDRSMEWFIVQKFGSKDTSTKTDELKQRIKDKDLGLLPIGGVAIPLGDNVLSAKVVKRHGANQTSHTNTSSSTLGSLVHWFASSYQKQIGKIKDFPADERSYKANNDFGKAFCFLPLPVSTGLPVHVNGHFALDHESRRELWKDGYRMDWNTFILEFLVVPSWIAGLLHIRKRAETDVGAANTWHNVNESLRKYHKLFPLHAKTVSKLWEHVATLFYCQIFRHDASLFAYVQESKGDISLKTDIPDSSQDRFCLKWTHLTSAVDSDLGGVFNDVTNLLSYISSLSDREKTSHLIGRLLKSFGMKLLETPKTIFEELLRAGIEDVPSSSPGLIISFMKSSNCEVGPVNVDISRSKFLTTNNLYVFLRFISMDTNFGGQIENLPVLQTEDGTFRVFSRENAVYLSRFSQLLPKSSCRFVHRDLRSLLNDKKLFDSGVCKKLCLEDFVRLLSHSVESNAYAVGSEIQLNVSSEACPRIVSKEWLCLLFDFLCDQARIENGDNKSQVKQPPYMQETPKTVNALQFRSNISTLQEWSFLPCIKNQKGDTFLIPIREAPHLLYLTYFQKVDALGCALQKLCLPTIDMKAFSKCLEREVITSVAEFIPSLNSPADVLECLVYHKFKISGCGAITIDDASEIMAYFGRTLSVLKENTEIDVVAKKLREIPLFITLQGTFTSIESSHDVLVIPRDMPCHGIQEWARRSSILLLQENDSFDVLYEFEGLQKADIEFVYAEKILPNIDKMPTQYWLQHITFLRDRFGHQISDIPAKAKLKQELKNIAFVNVRGVMKTVDELFDPENELFLCMKDSSDFPPENFQTNEWRHFLKELGLICDVDDNMIIAFACQIELEGRSRLSDTVQWKSEKLLNQFLRDRGTKWKQATLNRIKSIRFIKPYTLDEQRVNIWPQHGNGNAFICFQDSVSSSLTSLCWTSIDLLPQNIYQELKTSVRNMLGIHDEPPLDKVILHCQNVCDALKPLVKASSVSREFVEDQMTCFYEYLTRHIQSKSLIQTRLQYTPFVHLFDVNDPDLVLANEVIIDLPSYSQIKPYLYQAPKYYGKYHDLFQVLGSKHKIMCCHYATILQKIKDKCTDSELKLPFEKKITQKAVRGLLRLNLDSDESTDDVRHIFLPNQDLHLLKSTQLTIPNNYWFEDRLREHVEINYFAGQSFLQVSDNDKIPLQEMFSKWPDHLKPVLLSEVVEETICLESREQGIYSNKSMVIEKFFHSQEFTASLGGILQQQVMFEGTFCEKTFVSETVTTLKSIRVFELPILKTVLKYQGNVVRGSDMFIPYHIKIDLDGESKQVIFYFTDTNDTDDVDMSPILDGLLDLLLTCVPEIDKRSATRLMALLQCIDTPNKLPEILKRFQIKPFNSGLTFRRNYFPKPGTYVETRVIPFLEQGIEPFRDYEYDSVAMEIDDTVYDIDDIEDADPVYIYVQILHECDDSNLLGDLGKVYSVRTGNPDVFSEYVPIFRLYRFVRREEDPVTELQRYDSEPVNSRPFDEHCRRIRKDLKDAWKLPEDDRKRVIRRLYLKWHPDRNRENEDYYKKVFQYIKIVLSRLETGEDLSEDVDDEMSRGPSHFSQSSSKYYHNINRRAQSYARAFYDNYEEYSRCERTGSYCHSSAQNNSRPDAYEAKRWMRQAKNDLRAAVAMFPVANDVDGYNWICYLCHQACEKALKSAKYSNNANDVPKGSKSHYLAWLTSEPAILEQVQKLEARLGDHARLRYPDAVSRPRVPSDIYRKEDAQFAIDVARKVISLVDDDIS